MKKRSSSKPFTNISKILRTEKGPVPIRDGRIPHQQILQASESAARLVDAYCTEVLSQKTRSIRLLGKKAPTRILHTLLGYEVQASYKRIHCPDLDTARYLKLFSELGCHSIKLPYDPTVTARLVPQFEAMIDRIIEQVSEFFPGDVPLQRYVLRRLFGSMRRQLRGD